MSLPVPENPSPNSPSKPSIRKTSVNRSSSNNSPGPTTHFAAEHTSHHFLPHSPPNQTVDYDEDDDDDDRPEDGGEYIDQQNISHLHPSPYPQPHQPFQPFFTLIEDRATHEHYHPTVHYIFADDEPEIITEAACRSLQQNDHDAALEYTRSQEEGDTRYQHQPQQDDDDDELAPPRLPPSQPGIREHYLILDVHPSPSSSSTTDVVGGLLPNTTQQQQQYPAASDRLPSPSPSSVETAQALLHLKQNYPYTVTSAQSLSADWQILRTSITDAPTMNSEHEMHDHLMLRIEGRGNSPDNNKAKAQGYNNNGKEREALEEMIDRFQTRLAEIRHLLVDIDGVREEEQPHQQQREGVEGEENMFTQGGLVSVGYRPTGFGNAVLDEQD